MSNASSSKKVIWFSRLLRWALGVLFIAIGWMFFEDGGWPALVFGAVFFVTGFFRPKRCIEDGCELPARQ
ncbi:MAG TPA: DUF2892 domain-containing protein [Agriterribacter sp.]|nr:DUF2892 domain-containing protein [Agriterribacter sp.]